MPMRDFRCTQCGHKFEDIVKHSDPPPPCEECEGETEKQFTGCKATFVLIGPGFYRQTMRGPE